MAALSSLRTASASCVRPRLAARVAVPRPAFAQVGRRSTVAVRAQQDYDTATSPEVDKLVKDLQEKWDKVENKTGVVLYGAGAVILLWFSSTLVSALNAIPLLPKLLELIGLGYTSWFVYRYLLFKSSREELSKDVEELKKKITGEGDALASKASSSVSSFQSSVQSKADQATSQAKATVKSALDD